MQFFRSLASQGGENEWDQGSVNSVIFGVKFENSISADFLMKRALVKFPDQIFEQNRVLTHDKFRVSLLKWFVELSYDIMSSAQRVISLRPG